MMIPSLLCRAKWHRCYRYFASSRDIPSIINSLATSSNDPELFLSKLLSVSKEDFNRSLVYLIQQRQYAKASSIISALPERHSYHNDSTTISSLITAAHSHDAAKAMKIAKMCKDQTLSSGVLLNMHCEMDKLHLAEAIFLPVLKANKLDHLHTQLLDKRTPPNTSSTSTADIPLCYFLAMIKGYCYRGAWKQCDSVIQHLISTTSDQSIQEFCTTHQLLTHTVPAPSLSVISNILTDATTSPSPSQLVHLLPLLKHRQLFTNISTLPPLVEAITATIIKHHLSDTPVTTAVFESFTVDTYASFLLLPPPTAELTSSMIAKLVDALSIGRGMNELSLQVISELKSNRVPVPDAAYGSIIQGFCNANRVSDAIRLYDSLLSYGPTPLTLQLYHSIADCIIEQQSEREVEEFMVKYSALHAAIR